MYFVRRPTVISAPWVFQLCRIYIKWTWWISGTGYTVLLRLVGEVYNNIDQTKKMQAKYIIILLDFYFMTKCIITI